MGRANWPLQGPSWRNPVGKCPRGKRGPRELGNIQGSLLPVTSLWARNGAKGAGELQGWTWNSVRRDSEVEEGPGPQDGHRDGVRVCSSTARSADGREVRDWTLVPDAGPEPSSQDHTPARQTLHQLSVKWIFMCTRRSEAEVFAQAPVSSPNCSQAKARALGLCWDLVRPSARGAGPVWAGEMARLWGTS